MATKDEIVSAIEGMSVLDLADLVKELEQRLGVSAAAPVAVMAATAASPDAAAAEEEKFEFTVTLKDIGPNKIEVIKAVRELVPGLGLKEAKELVESAPTALKENIAKDESDTIKAKLEGVGAGVDIT